ncbi:lipid binding protein [Lentinula edodes]|uniref:Sorting nexin-4 n=1 Tax=Lentinula edodes TaxID=5353 RepID=A0A1Q3EIQ3_LENED|nr:lipid binding protein [Lentinula edodes]
MLNDDEDVFDSVTWESPTAPVYADHTPSTGPGYRQSIDSNESGPHDPKWEGHLITAVTDPQKELAETKDAYVSYLVSAKTNLPMFSTSNPSARRRFQDFVFLREHLVKDFPACVVPPLPGKHRLEYLTGDRFSPEFMERRRLEYVHTSLEPPLSNNVTGNAGAGLLRVLRMGPEPSPGIVDNITDTLLNAFSRVRKPDERFLDMREGVDKFEDGLVLSERLWTRVRNRTTDLTADYHDMAVAVQGLGFLESGITDPLNHFSNTLLEFSALLRHTTQTTTDPFLIQLHSLLTYSHANRAVLKLRDQKQLDFEELSDYLSGVSAERDRLAAIINGHAGSSGLGLGSYLKDRVDAIRGADDDRSRVEKMKKLDVKIKELQDAVTTAHETSDAFSDETLREQHVFQRAKEAEMKEMLGNFADGQIEFYKAAMEEWDRIIPVIQRIHVDV